MAPEHRRDTRFARQPADEIVGYGSNGVVTADALVQRVRGIALSGRWGHDERGDQQGCGTARNE
jgi:hypothetical protein